MSNRIAFAINRIAAPRLTLAEFFRLAVDLGVEAVEFRNDLEGVEIKDGTPPATIRDLASDHGLEVLSLNALYPFDLWDTEREAQALKLARYAQGCGAAGLVMCPFNSHDDARSDSERHADLLQALKGMAAILGDHGLTGHVEPLGFAQSALRLKRVALDAIAEVGGEGVFNLLHDSFHHHLVNDPDYFPDRTGLVQISGVEDADISVTEMLDRHRVLVGEADRLGTVEQVRTLLERGYRGYFSFEPFAEAIKNLDDPKSALQASMDYLRAALGAPHG